jgi:hypothetical protein
MTTQSAPYKKYLGIKFEDQADVIKQFAAENNIPSTTFPTKGSQQAPNVSTLPDPKPEPAPQPRKPKTRSAETRRFSVTLPVSLLDQIHKRYLQGKGKHTYRFIVTQAFKDAGYDVSEHDLIEDGRRDT